MKRTFALFAVCLCIFATSGWTSGIYAQQACDFTWTNNTAFGITYEIETSFNNLYLYTASANATGDDPYQCACFGGVGCEVVTGVWIHVGGATFVPVGTTDTISNGIVTVTVTVTATGMTLN